MYQVSNISDITIKDEKTDEVVLQCKAISNININENRCIETRVIKIEDGLKLSIRDIKLNEIQNEPYIKENFDLNIKRINRWWYSVYFKKKNSQ